MVFNLYNPFQWKAWRWVTRVLLEGKIKSACRTDSSKSTQTKSKQQLLWLNCQTVVRWQFSLPYKVSLFWIRLYLLQWRTIVWFSFSVGGLGGGYFSWIRWQTSCIYLGTKKPPNCTPIHFPGITTFIWKLRLRCKTYAFT